MEVVGATPCRGSGWGERTVWQFGRIKVDQNFDQMMINF